MNQQTYYANDSTYTLDRANALFTSFVGDAPDLLNSAQWVLLCRNMMSHALIHVCADESRAATLLSMEHWLRMQVTILNTRLENKKALGEAPDSTIEAARGDPEAVGRLLTDMMVEDALAQRFMTRRLAWKQTFMVIHRPELLCLGNTPIMLAPAREAAERYYPGITNAVAQINTIATDDESRCYALHSWLNTPKHTVHVSLTGLDNLV